MMLGFIHRRWGQEKRREFIGLAGGAVVWPLATRAQQPDKPVIGLLAQGTSTGWNLAGSLNHPGGNLTGSISLANELFGKQIGILHELVPQASHFGVLTHPKGIQREAVAQETQSAASALGLTVEMVYAGSSGEIDAALERLWQ
jgi:putative ABC transport system substrate-binding protein